MSWSCVQVEERLSDFLENALSESEQREFRTHADSCPRCAPLVAQVSRMIGNLHALELEPVPPMLASKILDQTLGPRKAKRDWLRWIPILWQPRFATGLVTVLATALIIFHATATSKANLTLADFNPVNIVQAANRRAHLAFARSVKFVNDLRVVYEIQSRLQPATSGTPGQQAPSATPSQQKPPNESQQNRLTQDSFAEVAALIANARLRSAP
ncbi:MAG TPA: anti-sigma factor [Verrucomicrobiae bacterium]|nr:anti-sigma factor [Verrucomicrobiae bacterium]